MEDVLLSFLSAVTGGFLVVMFRELLTVKKENNSAKQIARVALKNELERNHKNVKKKNQHGKTIENYIREEERYGHDGKLFVTSSWDSSKMEIARLNPPLAIELYSVYSFYETMKTSDYTNKVPINELDDYLNNYQLLMNRYVMVIG